MSLFLPQSADAKFSLSVFGSTYWYSLGMGTTFCGLSENSKSFHRKIVLITVQPLLKKFPPQCSP